jgi:hypothetical protein
VGHARREVPDGHHLLRLTAVPGARDVIEREQDEGRGHEPARVGIEEARRLFAR